MFMPVSDVGPAWAEAFIRESMRLCWQYFSVKEVFDDPTAFSSSQTYILGRVMFLCCLIRLSEVVRVYARAYCADAGFSALQLVVNLPKLVLDASSSYVYMRSEWIG